MAMNDLMAREYYFWLKFLDIRIGKQVSLVSFDNLPDSVIYPVSTIDFGFARLGHCAAHIIVGDLPVKADRWGNIPGTCTLINRGSIGPASPEGARRVKALVRTVR
jgi:DNA-binding LacI/PurR family transcriptional regulator